MIWVCVLSMIIRKKYIPFLNVNILSHNQLTPKSFDFIEVASKHNQYYTMSPLQV
jgi:hypothetical protein